ncbi:MAG: response regulator [bacterium]|nr:response regulator [bacterium]
MTDLIQILVVDDDPLVLAGFREILGRAGFSVVACSSGQAAVDMLAEKKFSVVLTDLFMPRISGMDVLNAALAADPDCVVIVVTGFASVRGAVDALRRGAADYVIKPCEDDELLHRIRLGLERAEMRAELRSKELDTEKMKAIAQTAVTVNDQINTPLNVILNSAEYIRLTRLPDSTDATVTRFHRTGSCKDQVRNPEARDRGQSLADTGIPDRPASDDRSGTAARKSDPGSIAQFKTPKDTRR